MKHRFNAKLSAFFLFVMLAPFCSIGQTKNVISTHRVFPKMDKVAEFEKALAAHAQKYHTGDAHWRVFAIQSGPDFGGYHITEGPTSWAGEDARGDLGADHMLDWNKNIAVHLTMKLQLDLSTQYRSTWYRYGYPDLQSTIENPAN